jgi:L-gulonate 3-dehydrogenase
MADRPIAVVGGGSIGVGWSVVFARAGRSVRVYEPDQSRRKRVRTELLRVLASLGEFGLVSESVSAIASRVEVTSDLETTLSAASYVAECAPEDLRLKRELFQIFGDIAPDDAPLASSSSAICPSAITAGLAAARQCLVAHPANPPYLLAVVELVPGPLTEGLILDRAESLLASVRMSPVRLRREIEGFVFNRLQGAVLREAYRLVDEGVVDAADLDRLMREGLGRRWSVLGPFETAELNTRGGVEVHAERLGATYARMSREESSPRPWSPELVSTVSKAVQQRFPREHWDEHVNWRDRALMALEVFRNANPVLDGPSGRIAIGDARLPVQPTFANSGDARPGSDR